MRAIGITLAALALVLAGAQARGAERWTTGATGRGAARWTPTASRLVYRGGADFGWAVIDERVRDGSVEVRFRPLGGQRDRAGGVVWRWRDATNYYVARANALENNVVVYKMVNGRRTDLKPTDAVESAYGVERKVASRVWHTIRVDFEGAEYRVTFDGTEALRGRDETFTEPGAVGVWSKSDSVTEFNAFRYVRRETGPSSPPPGR
jgi:hypothetical protein